jgi:hypothetical protein
VEKERSRNAAAGVRVAWTVRGGEAWAGMGLPSDSYRPFWPARDGPSSLDQRWEVSEVYELRNGF